MKNYALLMIAMLYSVNILPQSVLNPNYGLRSPVTAEIIKVDFNDQSTVVWLTIMSDIDNAWFCIDRNTFLVRPDGSRLRLTGLNGLPYCPATYRFKRPGEKVTFSLTFPGKGSLQWFSIVEECAGGCLSFRGVVTDEGLNGSLDEAYELLAKGDDMHAYRLFEDILSKADSLNLGIEGSLFTTLIMLDRSMGRPEAARRWYERMITSGAPDLNLYLENLKRQGVGF